jgi:anti-anti-sigma factor
MRRVVEDPATYVYQLSGDLLGSPEGYAFQEDVRTRVRDGAKHVVLDLGAVTRIDSSGIGILVAVMFSVSSAGGRLVMTGLPPRVKNALGIAMLLDHIEQAETAEAALAKLRT